MSQFDEDEHILAVLDEVGHGSRVLTDIGARLDGSNSANLIENHGWTGLLVDRNEHFAKELRQRYPQCEVHAVTMTAGFFINKMMPPATQFLSIDVDGQDWWLWASLMHRPALVVIETNPLPGLFVAPLDTSEHPDLRGGYGCSVDAAKALGAMKGYDYLGRTKANAFFTRVDLHCKYRLPEIAMHAGSPSASFNNVMA